MDEAWALLERMEAPLELVAWARPHGPDFEAAWDACPRPSWLMWIAGAAALSLGDAVLVVAAWAGEVAERVPEAEALAEETLRVAERCVRREATRAECLQVAEVADAAAQDAPASSRQAPPAGYGGVASGVAWVARAAEGLMTARLRAEAARMERAQRAASYLGVGVSALVENEPPIRLEAERVLEDPFHAELLYVVAALAEAAEALEGTLEATGAGESAAREATEILRALFAQV